MDTTAAVRTDFALEALRLLRDGRSETALALAADGVRSYPTYLGGYAVLADCYAALDDLDDAFVILAEAERRFPGRQVLQQQRTSYENRRTAPAPVPVPPAPEPVAEVRASNPVIGEHREASELLTNKRRRERKPVMPVEQKESPLRVIELGGSPGLDRQIRSTSMRLIPGLEYTSLRFEGQRRSGRSISTLPEPPAFRSFNRPVPSPFARVEPEKPRKVSLEELADRIGKVRMTADELEKKPPAPDPLADQPRRTLVTETLAMIYLQQKAFDKAIDAFQQLMETQPERREHFQALADRAASERDSAS